MAASLRLQCWKEKRALLAVLDKGVVLLVRKEVYLERVNEGEW